MYFNLSEKLKFTKDCFVSQVFLFDMIHNWRGWLPKQKKSILSKEK